MVLFQKNALLLLKLSHIASIISDVYYKKNLRDSFSKVGMTNNNRMTMKEAICKIAI